MRNAYKYRIHLVYRTTNNGQWYAPVLELNDHQEVSVYLPDGTWCHNDNDSDYYCRYVFCSSPRHCRCHRIRKWNPFGQPQCRLLISVAVPKLEPVGADHFLSGVGAEADISRAPRLRLRFNPILNKPQIRSGKKNRIRLDPNQQRSQKAFGK